MKEKKNPVGRQPRKKDFSTHRISLRVTEDEFEALQKQANKECEGNVSELLRIRAGLKGEQKHGS